MSFVTESGTNSPLSINDNVDHINGDKFNTKSILMPKQLTPNKTKISHDIFNKIELL